MDHVGTGDFLTSIGDLLLLPLGVKESLSLTVVMVAGRVSLDVCSVHVRKLTTSL